MIDFPEYPIRYRYKDIDPVMYIGLGSTVWDHEGNAYVVDDYSIKGVCVARKKGHKKWVDASFVGLELEGDKKELEAGIKRARERFWQHQQDLLTDN